MTHGILLRLGAFAAVALAQSPGTFTTTGSMLTPRFGHTATLLPDGRVLIAGGCADQLGKPPFCKAATPTAELYDPTTGTFTATGNMTTARWNHTATLLPDGLVLIAAGRGDGGSEDNLASAELYDPLTGMFTATGNMTMPSAHDKNTATLLSDGRVLITGCCSRAEIYDPSTGAFTPAAGSTQPPSFATATLLPTGEVLLASAFFPELYDPASASFSPTGALNAFCTQAALLANGTVLTAGGNDDPGPSAAAFVYDPSAANFNATGKMTAPRANFSITALPDGRALIAGGSTWTGFTLPGGQPAMAYTCCLASAELYDPSVGIFTATGSMTAVRGGHTATLLNSGEVLIAGGGGGMATAELYHPQMLIPAPALFSLSGDGRGQGAIWHATTGELASPSSPAVVGEALSMYTTSLADGGMIPPQVAIGGRLAEVLYFGAAPGYPGYDQVNFLMPNGVAPGPAVPVRLTYLSRPSNAVTIGVQ